MTACIIGVGNRWREDDGVSLVIVDKLKMSVLRDIADIFYLEERLFELQSCFSCYQKIVIIDALLPGKKPGKIQLRRLNGSDIILQYRLPHKIHSVYSLHDFDLLWQIQYAFQTGYKGELLLIGIEAGESGYGEGLSPQLKMVLPTVLLKLEHRILEFLRDSGKRKDENFRRGGGFRF